jgi:hypothetical protein
LGPLGDADKAIVEKAATQFGNNHDQLMDYFVGLAHFVNNPTAR